MRKELLQTIMKFSRLTILLCTTECRGPADDHQDGQNLILKGMERQRERGTRKGEGKVGKGSMRNAKAQTQDTQNDSRVGVLISHSLRILIFFRGF